MGKNKEPTYAEIIRQVLLETDGYIRKDDLVAKVLEIRQTSAKKPSTQIQHILKMDLNGELIAFLDKDTIACLNVVMVGVKFRIPISKFDAKNHALQIEFLRGVDPSYRNPEKYDFFDDQERKLKTKLKYMINRGEKLNDILGIFDSDKNYLDVGNWEEMKKAKQDDSVIVTIKSWEPRQFSLKLESKKEYQAHKDEIDKKNNELADILFTMLENDGSEYLPIRSAIPTAYIRMSDPKGYPGDHWIEVIENDERMSTNLFDIRYEDDTYVGLFNLLNDEKPKAVKKKVYAIDADQVYVFKANFKYKKGIWRLIEIKGNQTLADFDDILRDAFNHDSFDHLSGFWKLIRRGKTKRFREVELGDIYPDGGGDGAELKIAELEIQVGDRLKYVYDFGDWVEHEITLEGIKLPEGKSDYPRITEQNKPKYKYCQDCEAKGKKTIAEYICLECSNDEGREVLICEKCADKNHEDHYYEEYLY